MLLRDQLETTLNDLVVLSEEAADAYDSAAQDLDDADLAEMLRDLGAQRHGMGKRLRAQVRARGDIPRTPDPDFEAVRALFGRLKAAFAPDQRRSLIEHAATADEGLAQRLEQARSDTTDAELVQLLTQLAAEVQGGLGRLAAAKERLRPPPQPPA